MVRLLPHPPPPHHQHHSSHHNDHQHRNHHERDDGPVVVGEVEADANINQTESDGQGAEDAVADHEFRGLGGFAVDEVAGEPQRPRCHDEEEDDEAENCVGVAVIILLGMEHCQYTAVARRRENIGERLTGLMVRRALIPNPMAMMTTSEARVWIPACASTFWKTRRTTYPRG